MTLNLKILVIIATVLVNTITLKQNNDFKSISEHSAVTDENVYSYIVAVLKGNSFLSNGALINEEWVLTSADGVFKVNGILRQLRIRLGSINYKKGGEIRAVKVLEIHPYYESNKPVFDIALLMMSAPVRYTVNIRAIRIQLSPKEVSATHFIVTSWRGAINYKLNTTFQSTSIIKRQNLLSVSHLHPTDDDECLEELQELGFNNTGMMCLEPDELDICMNNSGAPVVLNGVLWGITSSYTVNNCTEDNASSMFASLVSAQNLSVWLHKTIHKHRWYNNMK